MELTGLGGGIMLAIAAALWLVYLVPSWLKSREYLATEKNAVRLQQTIRVLAETSEVSRGELLRQLPSGPVAVGRPARPVFETPDKRAVSAVHRLRRTRVATAFVLLASIVIAFVQVVVMLAGGAVGGSWLLLGGAGIGVLSSLAMLGRLAEVARSRGAVAARPARRTSLGARPAASGARQAQEWTPVPMPKPLYLSRGSAPALPAEDPAALVAAAAAAEKALREVEQPPSIAPAPEVTAPAARSRFASMGIVDAASAPAPDIDAALARRRAAG